MSNNGDIVEDAHWIDNCPFLMSVVAILLGQIAMTTIAMPPTMVLLRLVRSSHKQIYFGFLGFVNGLYWLDRSNTAPEAYCDMSNGGWTLVMGGNQ